MYLLGLDIGSSSIKASLVNASNGDVVGTIQSPQSEMDIISRQSGWAEQHPDIWWKNVCVGINKLYTKYNIDNEKIVSIGISYQMHGLVLVDENHQVLRPAIIWCDSRACTYW